MAPGGNFPKALDLGDSIMLPSLHSKLLDKYFFFLLLSQTEKIGQLFKSLRKVRHV